MVVKNTIKIKFEKNLNILDKSADVNPLHVVFSR